MQIIEMFIPGLCHTKRSKTAAPGRLSALTRQGGSGLSYDGELCAGEMLVPAGFSPGTGVCARGERRGKVGMRGMGRLALRFG